MQIPPFEIEKFFAQYEFSTPHLLCASDCETMSVAELLELSGRSLAALGGLRLGYTESQGAPELRQAVAKQYANTSAQHGGRDWLAVTADDVVIVAAPEEGIYLLMRTLLEPGDHVVVLTPAYNSLLNVAEHVSGNVSKWALQPNETGWSLDLDELDDLLTADTRLLIVNFPHNPTGYLPAAAEFQEIVALAQKYDVWLFCDEMYRGLELNGRSALPSAVTQYEKGIVLAGLSKVQGLPGLRSGWMVLRDAALRADFINWKHYTTICAPGPSEFLAQTAMHVAEELAARSRAIISENLQAADAFFARWPNLFTWRRPLAGSVALVEMHRPDVTEYCVQLAKDAGVLLLPGRYIDYRENFVRLGLGRQDFAANLVHFEGYLERQGRAA